ALPFGFLQSSSWNGKRIICKHHVLDFAAAPPCPPDPKFIDFRGYDLNLKVQMDLVWLTGCSGAQESDAATDEVGEEPSDKRHADVFLDLVDNSSQPPPNLGPSTEYDEEENPVALQNLCDTDNGT